MNKIKVLNYKIYLKVDIEKLILYGKTTINIEILEPIKEIILNSSKLLIKKINVNNNLSNYSENKKDELLIINIEDKSKEITIYIEYESEIGTNMEGLYYTKKNNSIIISTQLEPIYARKVFPCFDSPNIKSKFDVVIESDKTKTFLSNMQPKKEIIKTKNKIVEFETTPLMSTYLVCIVIGDIKKNKSELVRDDLYVNGYYFNETKNLMKTSIKITAQAIKYYEKIFKIKYTLPKMDIIAIPNFLSGAMENWGLVTFRESGLMIDDIDNILWIINSIEVIYHEISHQWFGNLVTLNSWKDIWLNEATATYFSWIGLIDNYKNLYPKQWYYLTTFRSAMLMDSYNSTHSISVEITNTNDVIQYFDEISYSKGSCLINYLSELMGREKFMLAISDYLKQYPFRSTTPEDLYIYLDKYFINNKYSISSLVEKFIKIKGLPLITVKKIDNKYKITKRKFIFAKLDKEDYEITFPFKIKFTKNNVVKEELYEFETEIILTEEPILNTNNMLLCIINYDNFYPNIKLMTIPELMHQIDSTYYLFLNGDKKIDYFIELLLKIYNTIDFTNNLSKYLCLHQLITKNLINLNYILKNSDTYETTLGLKFKDFIELVKIKIKNILHFIIKLNNYNITTKSWISDLINFLIEFNDNHIIEICKKIFDYLYSDNLNNNFDKFPFHEIIFKIAIKNNDNILKIKKVMEKTNNIFIKNSATWALANSNDVNELNFIIKNIFSIIKTQDISTFIAQLSKNSLIQTKIIKWIFSDIKTHPDISYKNFAHIVEKITPNIYSLNLLIELKEYYEKENDLSIYAIEIDKINFQTNIINIIQSYSN
jgi:hypothetical protein